MNGLLVGGSVAAIAVSVWSYIKGFFSKVRSLFIVKVTINGQLSSAVSFYCWKNMKRVRIGDRKYESYNTFVRPKDRYQHVAYELIGRSGLIFWKGWRFLLVGEASTSRDQTPATEDTGDLKISFIRGTWNVDTLIEDAVALYNKYIISGFQKRRFRVRRAYGTFGLARGQDGKVSLTPRTEDEKSEADHFLWDKRLLTWKVDDLGQRIHDSGKPFESLAFPDMIWTAIRDIERWKKSVDWYKEKGIPWKRGWLLYGVPGTGKTSLVRAIGEHLDVPVISFTLSSFTDREFQEEWGDLRRFTPCIALIEDIDTVFHGRTNITKGGNYDKPLNFDVLLNTIDGIQTSDGVFTIVTSNCIEHLDPAIGRPSGKGVTTRPGRIDRAIELKELGKEERRMVAKRILVDCPEFIEEQVRLGDGETGAQFTDRCAKLALAQYWGDNVDEFICNHRVAKREIEETTHYEYAEPPEAQNTPMSAE